MPLNRNQDFMFEDTTKLTTNAQSVKGALNEVNASLAQKVSQGDLVFSVKDKQFGAKGDGVTDDTTAIQAAIDYVYNAGGGIVFLPNGTYLISSKIYLRQYVSFLGSGERSCKIVKKAGTTGSMIEFKQENTSYIYHTKYGNFVLEGTGIATSPSPYTNASPDLTNDGLVINHYWGLDNCIFENITIENCGGTGLKIIPSPVNTASSEAMVMQQTLFNRVETRYCSAGTYIQGFVGNIQWNTCTFNLCTNNAFESAIGVNGYGPQDNTFVNCSFQFSNQGFYAGSNFINANFMGCHFEANGSYGAHINTTANCGEVLFKGCFFATTPVHLYFENMGGKATIENISWKNNGANVQSSDRYIKIGSGVTGLVYVGASQSLISSVATMLEDPSLRARGFTDFGTTFLMDYIHLYKGISSTNTNAKNLCGNIAVGSGATTQVVTFTNAETDTNYRITALPTWNAGSVWITGKQTGQFTLNFATAPATSGYSVDWMLLR